MSRTRLTIDNPACPSVVSERRVAGDYLPIVDSGSKGVEDQRRIIRCTIEVAYSAGKTGASNPRHRRKATNPGGQKKPSAACCSWIMRVKPLRAYTCPDLGLHMPFNGRLCRATVFFPPYDCNLGPVYSLFFVDHCQ